MSRPKQPLIILAAALVDNRGIGYNQALPWKIPLEWEYFQRVTTKNYSSSVIENEQTGWNNIVIMGRRSYESIEMQGKPLPNRFNIVVTRNKNYVINDPCAIAVGSLDEAMIVANKIMYDYSRVFVLGGSEIYSQTLLLQECTHVLLTNIHSTLPIPCDTFMPIIDSDTYRLASYDELREFVKDNHLPQGLQIYNNFKYEFSLYIRKQ
ncbi:dihydrofolate reductase-like domain-containing protein [Pilobolus umbonatus]|nr:dihydrofolate reductase-like domain-containing protein [Pilobolus umbonatus]